MCEIAVFKAAPVAEEPETFVTKMVQPMYEANNDGVGLAAVYPDEDDGTFEYDVIKAHQNPDWEQIIEWTGERADAWRIVVHARLATAGGTGFRQTHPIYVSDDDVDTKWAVHNGVVYSQKRRRSSLQDEGHEFNTAVDSEVIAHEYDTLPEQDELDEWDQPSLNGSLNFLLLGSEKILIRNEDKYTITDEIVMTCRSDWLGENDDSIIDDGYALITPDNTFETVEAESTAITATNGVWGGYTSSGTVHSRSATRGQSRSDDDETSSSRSQYSQTGAGRSRRRRTQSRSQQHTDARTGSSGDSDSDSDIDGADWGPIARAYFRRKQMDLTAREGRGGGYRLTLAEASIDGTPKIIAMVTDPDTGEPVSNAVLTAFTTQKHTQYDSPGNYETDQLGEAHIAYPPTGEELAVWLVQINDNDDGGDDGRVELTNDEASDIDWWHHYDQQISHISASGFCSMHQEEFANGRCEHCTVEFDKQTLMGPYKDAIDEKHEEWAHSLNSGDGTGTDSDTDTGTDTDTNDDDDDCGCGSACERPETEAEPSDD